MIRNLRPVDLTGSAGLAATRHDRPDVLLRDLTFADLVTTSPPDPVTTSPTALATTPPAHLVTAPPRERDAPLTWLRVRVPADERAWPDDKDLAGLVDSGVIGMTLDLPPLGELTGRLPWLIAFLVRVTSFGLPLEWGGDVADLGVPGELLSHLRPPSHGDAAARIWRESHRYGLCYWRRGNGFATVCDLRTQPGARYVIHEPPLLDLFHRLADPVDTATLDDPGPLKELVDAELAVTVGTFAVGLAYRLRRWPVPVIDF